MIRRRLQVEEEREIKKNVSLLQRGRGGDLKNVKVNIKSQIHSEYITYFRSSSPLKLIKNDPDFL